MTEAPGHPGIAPRWTTSAKSGVGTALQGGSRVSFTIGHGILNAIYFPRPDEACMRDMGLLITNGLDYFSEEKRDTDILISPIGDGVPGYILVNTSHDGRYRIEKRIIADPERDVVLQHIRFEAREGRREDYRVYALAAPHLVNGGSHNTASVDSYKGCPVLYASGAGLVLSMVAEAPFRNLSVGFVAESDGYTLLCGTATPTMATAVPATARISTAPGGMSNTLPSRRDSSSLMCSAEAQTSGIAEPAGRPRIIPRSGISSRRSCSATR